MPSSKRARKRNVRSSKRAEVQHNGDESSREEDDGDEQAEKRRGRRTNWLPEELLFLKQQLPEYKQISQERRRSEEMRKFKNRVTQMYIDKFSKDDIDDIRVRQMSTKVAGYFEYQNRVEKRAKMRKEKREAPSVEKMVENSDVVSLKKKALAAICMLAGVACKPTKVTAYQLYVEHERDQLDAKAGSMMQDQNLDPERAGTVHMKVRSAGFKGLPDEVRERYMELAEDITEENRSEWDRPSSDNEIYENQKLLKAIITTFFGLLIGDGRMGMGDAMFFVQYCMKGENMPLFGSLSISDEKAAYTLSNIFEEQKIASSWSDFAIQQLYHVGHSDTEDGDEYEEEEEDEDEDGNGNEDDDADDDEAENEGSCEDGNESQSVGSYDGQFDEEDRMDIDDFENDSSTSRAEGDDEWGGIGEVEWGGFEEYDGLNNEYQNAFTIEVAKAALVEQARQKKDHAQFSADDTESSFRDNNTPSMYTMREAFTDQNNQHQSVEFNSSSPTADKVQGTPSRSTSGVETVILRSPHRPQRRTVRQTVLPGLKSPRPQRTRKPATSSLKNFAEKYEIAANAKKSHTGKTDGKKKGGKVVVQ